MATGNGEKSNLKLQLGIAGSIISLLLIICGFLIQIGFARMSTELSTVTEEVKVLSQKVASLETAVTYMDRYGLPAGPNAVPERNSP